MATALRSCGSGSARSLICGSAVRRAAVGQGHVDAAARRAAARRATRDTGADRARASHLGATGELVTAAEAELDGIAAGLDRGTDRVGDPAPVREGGRVPVELAVARARPPRQGYETWVAARAARRLRRVRAGARAQLPTRARLHRLLRRATTIHTTWFSMTSRPACGPPRRAVASRDARSADATDRHVARAARSTSRHCTSTIRSLGSASSSTRCCVGWASTTPAGGLDDTIHPFETSFSVTDVRLTTRYHEDYFPAGSIRHARVRPRAV